MRFVVDECVGSKISDWLKARGHDIIDINHSHRGISDEEVLGIAVKENCILITDDKGFGNMVFSGSVKVAGIILLRLKNERLSNRKNILEKILLSFPDLNGKFVVATEEKIRLISLPH